MIPCYYRGTSMARRWYDRIDRLSHQSTRASVWSVCSLISLEALANERGRVLDEKFN
jgi:hypothetical protein